eukprot:scaffold118_cov382-Prasinococcus_capsulatus_cf.AAC.8
MKDSVQNLRWYTWSAWLFFGSFQNTWTSGTRGPSQRAGRARDRARTAAQECPYLRPVEIPNGKLVSAALIHQPRVHVLDGVVLLRRHGLILLGHLHVLVVLCDRIDGENVVLVQLIPMRLLHRGRGLLRRGELDESEALGLVLSLIERHDQPTLADGADLREELAENGGQLLKLLLRHNGDVVHQNEALEATLRLHLFHLAIQVVIAWNAHVVARGELQLDVSTGTRSTLSAHSPKRPEVHRVWPHEPPSRRAVPRPGQCSTGRTAPTPSRPPPWAPRSPSCQGTAKSYPTLAHTPRATPETPRARAPRGDKGRVRACVSRLPALGCVRESV